VNDSSHIIVRKHSDMVVIANIPVDETIYQDITIDFRHHISEIEDTKIRNFFQPVVCPLTDRVMHLDKSGFLWPCQGCTRPDCVGLDHAIYCRRSDKFGINGYTPIDNPPDDPSVPMEYIMAYCTLNYVKIRKNAEDIIRLVKDKHGGTVFLSIPRPCPMLQLPIK